MKPLHPAVALLLALVLLAPAAATAHDPEYTSELGREHCTFTSTGNTVYFPLWPGLSLRLVGEEEDDGELVELEVVTTVLHETEMVDGVETRVFEERESEDGELVEVSRNFVAVCRETGDVWYFGEDVDDIEDGEVVGHEGEWRAGENGARAGILMPGNPLIGARYFQEQAPGVALDRGEIVDRGLEVTVPAGTFTDVLEVLDTDALEPSSEGDPKLYAPFVGNIVDEELELVEITPPDCRPDATTHCLNDGRFQVRVEWATPQGTEGPGFAILPSDDSGEFWFFNADNTELIVKVLDACEIEGFNSFWVFAAGLTDVEVVITVFDTESLEMRTYENPLSRPFEPILDTDAFFTCP